MENVKLSDSIIEKKILLEIIQFKSKIPIRNLPGVIQSLKLILSEKEIFCNLSECEKLLNHEIIIGLREDKDNINQIDQYNDLITENSKQLKIRVAILKQKNHIKFQTIGHDSTFIIVSILPKREAIFWKAFKIYAQISPYFIILQKLVSSVLQMLKGDTHQDIIWGVIPSLLVIHFLKCHKISFLPKIFLSNDNKYKITFSERWCLEEIDVTIDELFSEFINFYYSKIESNLYINLFDDFYLADSGYDRENGWYIIDPISNSPHTLFSSIEIFSLIKNELKNLHEKNASSSNIPIFTSIINFLTPKRNNFTVIDLTPTVNVRKIDKNIIDQYLVKIFKYISTTLHPDPNYYEILRSVIGEIEGKIKTLYNDIKIIPFGSFSTGLGWWSSDIDVVGLIDVNQNEEISILKKICKLFRKNEQIRIETFIKSARVPIIQFYYTPLNIKFDLSLNNILGIYNSLLIRSYSQINPIFSQLFCCLKYYVKVNKMIDHVNNQITSYSWIILLIHFLQKHSPSHLPYLQTIHDGASCPKVMVGLSNIYFYTNLTNLKNHWENKNQDFNVPSLFLKFFEYYSRFNYERHVISIINDRIQLKNSEFITLLCIEDPFIVGRNLSSHLTWLHAQQFITFMRTSAKHLSNCYQEIDERISLENGITFIFENFPRNLQAFKLSKARRHDVLEKRKLMKRKIVDEVSKMTLNNK